LRSKSFEGAAELNKEDYWYKTKYGYAPFPESLLKKMLSPSVKITTKKLDLPPPNNLLPENLDVLSPEPESSARPFILR
jgi:secreted Zn-dependent insulinase-like peptidase